MSWQQKGQPEGHRIHSSSSSSGGDLRGAGAQGQGSEALVLEDAAFDNGLEVLL